MMLCRSPSRYPRKQVAGVSARRRPGVVLVDLESDLRQLVCDVVRARALVARRTLDPAQCDERVVKSLSLGVACPPHGAAARVTL